MVRFSEGGCSSSGIEFVRPDFLTPFSVKEEGPSAMARFQGGDSFLILAPVDDGVPSLTSTLRLLLGLLSPFLSASLPLPFSFCASSLLTEGSVDGLSQLGYMPLYVGDFVTLDGVFL